MKDDMNLFSYSNAEVHTSSQPLAVRMRPRTFEEFIGHEEMIGNSKFLRKMIESDHISSMIIFGPPGTGKTTLAHMIAAMTNSHFEKLNAVSAGIADIRKIVDAAKERLQFYQKRTIVFIDEIHRFNKSQQDVLLPYVEDGRIILIGATTENPYFEVNLPLLSRVRIVRLQLLSNRDIVAILKQALSDRERGLGLFDITCSDEMFEKIAAVGNGDARVALNILEQASMLLSSGGQITNEILREIIGEKLQTYDKTGDNHYDTISAFIKSMRGSDPDAALHYLARMLVAGENLNFIARRIAICAAEDVGNADPQALVIAMAAVQSVQFLGMPEARIPLAQAVTYVASAPKSNAAYLAIDAAISDVKNKNCGQIPLHLRDAHYKGAAKLGHGETYLYPHNYENHFIVQHYLPDELDGATYYSPTENGTEKAIRARLKQHWGKKY
uniref:replication-associated recombination protein A n=1 Tax=Massilibacillus massiliensis TaxID=1806837 RepID=UPI000A7B79D4|nr:replication-associated recombination protein A [Massilibacillus massiliensis]